MPLSAMATRFASCQCQDCNGTSIYRSHCHCREIPWETSLCYSAWTQISQKLGLLIAYFSFTQLFLKFCTEHGSDAVYWTIEMNVMNVNVMDEQDSWRMVTFRWILYIAQLSWIGSACRVLSCLQTVQIDWPLNLNCMDGLVQDCSNSIANALELLQSITKPSIWCRNALELLQSITKPSIWCRNCAFQWWLLYATTLLRQQQKLAAGRVCNFSVHHLMKQPVMIILCSIYNMYCNT